MAHGSNRHDERDGIDLLPGPMNAHAAYAGCLGGQEKTLTDHVLPPPILKDTRLRDWVAFGEPPSPHRPSFPPSLSVGEEVQKAIISLGGIAATPCVHGKHGLT